MPNDQSPFQERLQTLLEQLVRQGESVQGLIEQATEAVFARDAASADDVVERDAEIDRVDVLIEQRAVKLLSDAGAAGQPLSEADLRRVMTIVKVNNEFERIADLAVTIAEQVRTFASLDTEPLPKFRVMANSVIGIMQNTNSAFAHTDGDTAQLVLAVDDYTEAFAEAIRRDVAEALAGGSISVDFAFALNRVGACLARIADHCTNVAEQTIYVTSGRIVRHRGDKWSEPAAPDLSGADDISG